jgi:hypothetical protein
MSRKNKPGESAAPSSRRRTTWHAYAAGWNIWASCRTIRYTCWCARLTRPLTASALTRTTSHAALVRDASGRTPGPVVGELHGGAVGEEKPHHVQTALRDSCERSFIRNLRDKEKLHHVQTAQHDGPRQRREAEGAGSGPGVVRARWGAGLGSRGRSRGGRYAVISPLLAMLAAAPGECPAGIASSFRRGPFCPLASPGTATRAASGAARRRRPG